MLGQWRKIQSLPFPFLTELKTFYGKIFPIEVRDGFSDWIEEQPWKQIEENDQSHTTYAIKLLEELLTRVSSKAKIIPTLQPVLQNLQNKYTSNPLLLVSDMKACFDFEEKLIAKSENDPVADMTEAGGLHCDVLLITNEFNTLYKWDSYILQNVEELKKKGEEFAILLNELPLVTDHFERSGKDLQEEKVLIENLQTETLERRQIERILELEKEVNELQTRREFIKTFLVNCIKDINELISKVITTLGHIIDAAGVIHTRILVENIPEWKQRQQMACNGDYLNPDELRSIQKRCECLGNIIIKSVQHNLQMETILNHLPLKEQPEYITVLQNLRKKQSKLLIQLVSQSFIVEHQPPQVLRKETKFEAWATLLVSKAIQGETSLPKITAHLVSEEQARTIETAKVVKSIRTCGELLNNEAAADCLQCGSLSAKFKNLVLRQYKRESKRTGQKVPVSEEKYCIVFECNVVIRIGPLRIKRSLRTLSVPVIITTNVSQECQALATIAWDHQFSTQGRKLFEVPKQVPWILMANLLDKKFKHETGRGLTQIHLNCLASKLFGPAEDYEQYYLTFDMFCKANMTDSCLTFWDWFYHTMRLTKDHLTRPWKEGHIAGFVSKVDVDRLLSDAQPGTFVCRFSDTKSGGISVVERREDEVSHTEPFTAKDLQIRSLSNLINDQDRWKHLYPDKTKEDTFGKYANEEMSRSDSKSSYEKFMWTIRLNRQDDQRELQDCLKALNELIEGTDVIQFIKRHFNEDNMIVD